MCNSVSHRKTIPDRATVMEFYSALKAVLRAETPQRKFDLFHAFYDDFRCASSLFENRDESSTPATFDSPSWEGLCRETTPDQTPSRSRIGSLEGRRALLHSLAHIEYNAIDLALDAVYRFRSLPVPFVRDWLEVAAEEILHFQTIQKSLQDLETVYGDLPVHRTLFEVARSTEDPLARMAVIPRHLEAVGLDVNPGMMRRFGRFQDSGARRIEDALKMILRDEIDHVRKGDRWFRYLCEKRCLDVSAYFSIVSSVLPGAFPLRVPPNREARIQAGFAPEELDRITNPIGPGSPGSFRSDC